MGKSITILYSAKDTRKKKPLFDRIVGGEVVKSKTFKSKAEAMKFKKKVGKKYLSTGYGKAR